MDGGTEETRNRRFNPLRGISALRRAFYNGFKRLIDNGATDRSHPSGADSILLISDANHCCSTTTVRNQALPPGALR